MIFGLWLAIDTMFGRVEYGLKGEKKALCAEDVGVLGISVALISFGK